MDQSVKLALYSDTQMIAKYILNNWWEADLQRWTLCSVQRVATARSIGVFLQCIFCFAVYFFECVWSGPKVYFQHHIPLSCIVIHVNIMQSTECVWLVWPGPKVYFQRETSQGLAAGRVSLVNVIPPLELFIMPPLELLMFILFIFRCDSIS